MSFGRATRLRPPPLKMSTLVDPDAVAHELAPKSAAKAECGKGGPDALPRCASSVLAECVGKLFVDPSESDKTEVAGWIGGMSAVVARPRRHPQARPLEVTAMGTATSEKRWRTSSGSRGAARTRCTTFAAPLKG